MNELIFYVYAYLRKSNNTPYYIGKGKGNRVYQKHAGLSIPKDKAKIVFLETKLTELGSLALERRYIRWYGRKDLGTGILLNQTDGGEGTAGIIPWNKGVPCTDEMKNIISIATTGLKRTQATKLKMSIDRKGKQQTNNRLKAVEQQKDSTSFNWNHPVYGSVYCSVWELLEKYSNVTIVGLRHVIYGYQNKHRDWYIT